MQQLNPNQIDTIAEKAQTIRLTGKPKAAQKVVQEVSAEPWSTLTTPAKDYVRLTVASTIEALEASGFEVRQRETAGGASRSA